jgi:uncharacterized protein (DUF1778 family)
MRKTETTERSRRGITINLRADHTKGALIDRAAERVGKNRSEFMLEAACREATEVLLVVLHHLVRHNLRHIQEHKRTAQQCEGDHPGCPKHKARDGFPAVSPIPTPSGGFAKLGRQVRKFLQKVTFY